MEELGETVELQVPFLGLESKQSGKQTLFWMNNTTAIANDASDLSAPKPRQHVMPFVKYGTSLHLVLLGSGSAQRHSVL